MGFFRSIAQLPSGVPVELEKISSLTAGRLYWGDIYAKSFYELAKIYQEKGWKAKDIEILLC